MDLRRFPGFVHEDPGVRDESGRRASDVVVDLMNLLGRLGLDELVHGPPVYDEGDSALVLHTDGSGSLLNGLAGVLHLEKSSIRGEDAYSLIICHLSGLHFLCSFILRVWLSGSSIKTFSTGCSAFLFLWHPEVRVGVAQRAESA